MTVYSNGGANSSTMTTPLTVTSTGEIPLLFSSLSGNADLTDVNAIAMKLSGVGHAGSDIAIGSLTTSTPNRQRLCWLQWGLSLYVAWAGNGEGFS